MALEDPDLLCGALSGPQLVRDGNSCTAIQRGEADMEDQGRVDVRPSPVCQGAHLDGIWCDFLGVYILPPASGRRSIGHLGIRAAFRHGGRTIGPEPCSLWIVGRESGLREASLWWRSLDGTFLNRSHVRFPPRKIIIF